MYVSNFMFTSRSKIFIYHEIKKNTSAIKMTQAIAIWPRDQITATETRGWIEANKIEKDEYSLNYIQQ